MITILQLVGLGNTNDVLFLGTDKSGEQRHLEIENISPLLETLDPSRFRHRKLLYGGMENPINLSLTPNIVYNSISDTDRCSRALDRAQHAAKSNPYPFINHPALIPNTRPDKLFQHVAAISGMTAPQCIRITPTSLKDVRTALKENGMTAPLIFKEAETAPGQENDFLLNSMDDLHDLERFAFDGRAYYVTHFIDYRSKDGLYRTYRFYVIGSKILPGHLIISDQWQIQNDLQAHAGMDDKRSTLEKEEKEFLKTYQKKRLPALVALQEKMGLDFYALDCSFDAKGDLILFKVDGGAHYFDTTKEEGYYSSKQLTRYREAVETMIVNKLDKQKVSHG